MPKLPFVWKSMEEVIPAVLQSWLLLRNYGHQVNVILLSKPQSEKKIKIPKGTTDIVVGCLHEFSYSKMLRTLAEHPLIRDSQLWIHLYGEPQKAMLFGADHLLPKGTIYIVASEAEKKSLRLTRPGAKALVLPFPLGTIPTLPKTRIPKAKQSPIRIAYAGRISKEKNLESVIHATKILHSQGHHVEFEIYGPFDKSGNLHFGEKTTSVNRDIPRLIKKLKLEDVVKLKGPVSRDALAKLWDGGRIFVSASLHWDENFGAAAFQALQLGSPAVLSAWGGHQQLKQIFKNRVRLVPVYLEKSQCKVDSKEIASAILTASKTRGRDKVLVPTPATAAKQLDQWIRTEAPSRNATAFTPLGLYLAKRNDSKYNNSKQLFEGTWDNLAKPFMIAYGAKAKGW